MCSYSALANTALASTLPANTLPTTSCQYSVLTSKQEKVLWPQLCQLQQASTSISSSTCHCGNQSLGGFDHHNTWQCSK